MKQVSGAARGKRAPLDLSRNSNSVHDKEKRLRKLLTSGLAAMVVVPGKVRVCEMLLVLIGRLAIMWNKSVRRVMLHARSEELVTTWPGNSRCCL